MPSIRPYAWRILPLLFLLALYWPGLTNWFYQDDFGWLNLRRGVHSVADLAPALFAPKAHGNMRPLGENAYFLILSSIFGVDALPFRICAFATQMASLLLLGCIAARITASRAAGFWAQALWIANTGLAPAMCWTSIYNQLLSGFFFLLALYFFQRNIESGGTRFAAAHWIAFVLSLGALETNVMYPAIAAAYALLFARPYVKKILPMFLVSALAVAIHFHFAPPPAAGLYAPRLDGRIFATLWSYWMLAWGPWHVGAWLLTVAAVVFALRHKIGLFGLVWFVLVLCPYLPLAEHKMDYYLAVPVVGLAILGAGAITLLRMPWKVIAVGCIAAYLAASVPAARAIAVWNHERGTRVEDLVLGVADIHAAQPGKTILLDNVDDELFTAGIVDVPFRVMEIPRVYLTPGYEDRVKYALPQALALSELNEGRAVVYRVDGSTLRNVTGNYRATVAAAWKPETPRFINLGDSIYGRYLGAGWDAPADGYRLLRASATVRIGGPKTTDERLYVGVFRTRDVHLAARVNGVDVHPQIVERTGELTEFAVSLPAAPEIEVTLTNGSPEPLRFGFLELR